MKVSKDWTFLPEVVHSNGLLSFYQGPEQLGWYLKPVTDMFRALRSSDLPSSTVFTVTIGAHDKVSEADYYLPEPTSVWATIDMFNECDGGSPPLPKRL